MHENPTGEAGMACKLQDNIQVFLSESSEVVLILSAIKQMLPLLG